VEPKVFWVREKRTGVEIETKNKSSDALEDAGRKSRCPGSLNLLAGSQFITAKPHVKGKNNFSKPNVFASTSVRP